MGTWIKRPDANGVVCDCRPAVCDPCASCRYFGDYARIVGYSDGIFALCSDPASYPFTPAWDGVFYEPFAVTAPCFWSELSGPGDRSLNAQQELLYGANLFTDRLRPGVWKMRVQKYINFTSSVIEAWYGESSDTLSGDPDGVVILRQSGCSAGPASVTIERFT